MKPLSGTDLSSFIIREVPITRIPPVNRGASEPALMNRVPGAHNQCLGKKAKALRLKYTSDESPYVVLNMGAPQSSLGALSLGSPSFPVTFVIRTLALLRMDPWLTLLRGAWPQNLRCLLDTSLQLSHLPS